MIIYKVTNKINGMSYIGQTVNDLDKRKREHIRRVLNNKDNIYFHNALRKYGAENFDWDIIEECDDIDELNKLEVFYIGFYNTYFEGYNLTRGGDGIVGYKHSEETCQKLSELGKGNKYALGCKHTKEACQKMSKPKTKNHKKKMSEARKGRFTGKNNPCAKSIILIHSNGKEEQFDCIMDAERKYSLIASHLSAVAKGRRNHTKGYKCKYV